MPASGVHAKAAHAPRMPRLLLLTGSLRRASFNTRLLDELGARLAGRCHTDQLLPAEAELPLFNQDLEQDAAIMARVAAVHGRFSASHGIVVASPEYNGQLPPCLKNVVDWVSRLAWVDARHGNPFIDRPILLCSASTGGSGGALAIPHARALFGYVGANVIGDTVCLPHAGQAWTGDGWVFSDGMHERIDAALDRVLRLAGDFAAAASQ